MYRADNGLYFSVADLEPIGLTTYYSGEDVDTASIVSASSRLRGRVSQVGELAGSAAGSANKVITGVVDSSWTALRGLMAPNLGLKPGDADTGTGEQPARPPMASRKSSGFTLASVTATVANIASATTQRQRARASSNASVLDGRELHPVMSRPDSIRESPEESASETASNPAHHDDTDDDSTQGAEPDDEIQRALGRSRQASDVRSIRSVSSMMSKLENERGVAAERLSIHERFANLGLNRSGSGNTSPPIIEGNKVSDAINEFCTSIFELNIGLQSQTTCLPETQPKHNLILTADQRSSTPLAAKQLHMTPTALIRGLHRLLSRACMMWRVRLIDS